MSGIRMADDLDVLRRAEIEDLQAHNLAITVAAAMRTPLTRRRWPALATIASVADLARLPLMTPDELADAGPPRSRDLLLDGEQAGLVIGSSGTTRKRKVLYHTWQNEVEVGSRGARGVRRALPTAPRRIGNVMESGNLFGAFLFGIDVARRLPAQVFPLAAIDELDEVADIVAEHAIDTLFTYPAYAARLFAVGGERLGSVRHLLYIGGGLGAASRRAIQAAAPHLVIRSLAYSTSETGPIGYQCGCCDDRTHHVHDDAVLVEIVHERTGQPVEPGQIGEVIATPLVGDGMALFRYRIGDRARWAQDPCPCGSEARRLVLEGRVDQSINVHVTVISEDLLMSVLSPLGVTSRSDCQLQVRWSGSTYRVRLLLSPLVPAGLSGEAVLASLRGASDLRSVLDDEACAGFSCVRADPAEFATSPSGKIPLLYQHTVQE